MMVSWTSVISRPIVLTMPEMPRITFYQQSKDMLSPFMRCGVRCLDNCFRCVSGTPFKGGSIVVMQTHGRHGPLQPHLPIIATSGGWEQQAKQWENSARSNTSLKEEKTCRQSV
ncbi:hypothetical protein NKDENANG_03505 [Candidatus Entotheonellaceae bacterium PAL068K]